MYFNFLNPEYADHRIDRSTKYWRFFLRAQKDKTGALPLRRLDHLSWLDAQALGFAAMYEANLKLHPPPLYGAVAPEKLVAGASDM